MFQTSVLASGSKGNVSIVRTKTSKVMFDAGLSGKKIIELLETITLSPQKVNALVVSHEHSDHIRGAGIICRKLKIPLFITRSTYLIARQKIGNIPAGIEHFEHGKSFQVGDILIEAVPSQHDAVEGSNFICSTATVPEQKLGIVTDLGYPSRLLLQKLKNVTTLVLESNHDLKMLMTGPYPWELKQRVKSREGHLSNEQAVAVIGQIMHNGLKNLVLAHLSEENNEPKLARNTMEMFLNSINADIELYVADQFNPTPLISI
jgi:phosphoribosyl 1,2-cyclic phosphodiesterase